MTRTFITAIVSFTLYTKGENGVVSDTHEETLVKCDSKEKAMLLLSKKYKGALIDITNIQYVKTVRKISEEDFFMHSTVVSEEIVEM